jgi:hypothetical protein
MGTGTTPEQSDIRWLQRFENLAPDNGGNPAMGDHPAETVLGSVQPLQNQGHSREHPLAAFKHGRPDHGLPDHGLPERTITEISQCLQERFPQLHWLKLYGSRAMGRHWQGSDIDLAFSADEDCSAALHEALDQLPTPYLFDVNHWESLRHQGLRDHIQRIGRLFP